jgi:DNA primase
VVLFFDGDGAGRRATHAALSPLLAAGMTVSVATAPDGLDTDELVRNHGKEAALSTVEGAADLPTFLVDEARRNFPVTTLEGKLAALEMVLQHLSHLPNSVARTEIMSKVADGLSIEDALFRQELRRVASERRREVRAPAASTTVGARRLTHAEQVVVRFLGGRAHAADAEVAELIATLDSVGAAHLGELAGVLVRRWCEAFKRGERWDLRRIAEAAPEEARAEILALAFAPGEEPGAAEARGALAALHGRVLGRRLREVQEEIERTADPAARSRLMLEKVSLAREMQGLGTAEAGAAAGPVHGGGR